MKSQLFQITGLALSFNYLARNPLQLDTSVVHLFQYTFSINLLTTIIMSAQSFLTPLKNSFNINKLQRPFCKQFYYPSLRSQIEAIAEIKHLTRRLFFFLDYFHSTKAGRFVCWLVFFEDDQPQAS